MKKNQTTTIVNAHTSPSIKSKPTHGGTQREAVFGSVEGSAAQDSHAYIVCSVFVQALSTPARKTPRIANNAGASMCTANNPFRTDDSREWHQM